MRWVVSLFAAVCCGCGLTGEFDLDEEGTDTDSSEGASASTSAPSGSASGSSSGGEPLPGCEPTPLRVATFNIQSVGVVGTDQYIGLVASLYRVDADVACLQEVESFERVQLEAAAADAGYDYVVEADRSPAIGGDIHNACLSKVPIELIGSYSGDDLSTDSRANDVGRDILGVRVEPNPGCNAGLFTVHLKAGFEFTDRFRRQVEVERLAQAVELYTAQHPDEPVVVAGDFNETLDEEALGSEFSSVPDGLPGSYELGNDIAFPLTYDPFARVAEAGFSLIDATWQDSTIDATWGEVVRLDYAWYRGAEFVESEVYNACRDDGEGGIDKRGEPLACYSSVVASDHLPVVVDLLLLP